MRRVLRIVVGLVAVLAAVVLIAGGVVAFAFPKSRPAPDVTIASTPERIERGRYLVEHVADCYGCHTPRAADRYSAPPIPSEKGGGGATFDHALGFPGSITPPNITPDRETGIGAWTDGELLRTMREGIARDGHAAFPFSPYTYYRHMSDEDAASVIAYMKTVPAISHRTPPIQLDFPVNVFIRFGPEPINGPVAGPPPGDHVKNGEYLVTLGGCMECHSEHDDRGQIIAGREYAGGFHIKGPWGDVVSTNITPAKDTFVGVATREQFVARFKAHAAASFEDVPKVAPSSNTPMPWFALSGMTEADLGDVYDYLKTLPPRPSAAVKTADAR